MSQPYDFSLLPIPDNMESVLDADNRLPIQYIPENWGVLVLSDQSRSEYDILTGKQLHKDWESMRLVHFSPSSTRIPHDVIQAVCPDGCVLGIKILSYGRQNSARPSARAATTPEPENKPNKPLGKFKLKQNHA